MVVSELSKKVGDTCKMYKNAGMTLTVGMLYFSERPYKNPIRA
jgi:hypothetical protein